MEVGLFHSTCSMVPILTNHEIYLNPNALLKVDSHTLFIVYCLIFNCYLFFINVMPPVIILMFMLKLS